MPEMGLSESGAEGVGGDIANIARFDTQFD